jgi:hypothetical protein
VLNEVANGGADVTESLETIGLIHGGDANGWYDAWAAAVNRDFARAEAARDSVNKGLAYLRAHNYWRSTSMYWRSTVRAVYRLLAAVPTSPAPGARARLERSSQKPTICWMRAVNIVMGLIARTPTASSSEAQCLTRRRRPFRCLSKVGEMRKSTLKRMIKFGHSLKGANDMQRYPTSGMRRRHQSSAAHGADGRSSPSNCFRATA